MSLTETHRYDDIIDLPHHQSQTHAHMSMHNRAAQFMAFRRPDRLRRHHQTNRAIQHDAVERANRPVDLERLPFRLKRLL